MRIFSIPVWYMYILCYRWGHFPYQFDISYVIDKEVFPCLKYPILSIRKISLPVWYILYYQWGNFPYQLYISAFIGEEIFPTSLKYPILSMSKFSLPVWYILYYPGGGFQASDRGRWCPWNEDTGMPLARMRPWSVTWSRRSCRGPGVSSRPPRPDTPPAACTQTCGPWTSCTTWKHDHVDI